MPNSQAKTSGWRINVKRNNRRYDSDRCFGALVVARIRRSVREKQRAIEGVKRDQTWRREESDPDGDPWTAVVTVYLRVMEIKHNTNGVKWCRCVRYCRTEEGCQSTEINLRAEQIVDEYEQCE